MPKPDYRTPLVLLGLPVRAETCFRRHGIDTVEAVLQGGPWTAVAHEGPDTAGWDTTGKFHVFKHQRRWSDGENPAWLDMRNFGVKTAEMTQDAIKRWLEENPTWRREALLQPWRRNNAEDAQG